MLFMDGLLRTRMMGAIAVQNLWLNSTLLVLNRTYRQLNHKNVFIDSRPSGSQPAIYGDSTLLVLNRTTLNSVNALLALPYPLPIISFTRKIILKLLFLRPLVLYNLHLPVGSYLSHIFLMPIMMAMFSFSRILIKNLYRCVTSCFKWMNMEWLKQVIQNNLLDETVKLHD